MSVRFNAAARLVILLSCAGCLPDASWKQRNTTVPEKLNDGWQIGSPESVGLDPIKLSTIHDELLREDANFGALAFLVVKDGRLVFETYLRTTADRDHVHPIQSMTKSITSIAVGMARADGVLTDLDRTLYDVMPRAFDGIDRAKHDITLEQILTMRSGIDFGNEVFAVELLVDRPSDPLHYILDKPLYADPGERFEYRDADPQLMGYALEHETRQREEDFVRDRLFEPLAISDYYWESAPDGTTLAPFGLHLRPRDVAKIGQLLLDSCTHGDSTILPSDWCQLATATHVPPADAGRGEPRGYGYYFWTLPEDEAFAAWGHGGQFILVVPSQELVLVQVALPDAELDGSELMDFVRLTSALYRERT